ncbi:cutinase family protein [Frondihabitans sp. VKM Ac-2883]|nr:cutinase family protein [Frondihabitans sp. VKM Ac-2883]
MAMLPGLAGTSPAVAKIMPERCGAGLIFIGVRGTGERPGMGGTVGLVQSFFNEDKDIPTWSQALTYPATATSVPDPYYGSVKTGATNLRSLLGTIFRECPHASINLAGYSQGAHVIGNVLSGSGVSPIASSDRHHITSVVFFGDPSYRAGEKYNSSASGRGNGLFARGAGALASWTRLAYPSATSSKPKQMPIIRSYCYTGDRWCQKGLGSNADAIHSSYASRSTYAAYAFMRAWNIDQTRSGIPVVKE